MTELHRIAVKELELMKRCADLIIEWRECYHAAMNDPYCVIALTWSKVHIAAQTVKYEMIHCRLNNWYLETSLKITTGALLNQKAIV